VQSKRIVNQTVPIITIYKTPCGGCSEIYEVQIIVQTILWRTYTQDVTQWF